MTRMDGDLRSAIKYDREEQDDSAVLYRKKDLQEVFGR